MRRDPSQQRGPTFEGFTSCVCKPMFLEDWSNLSKKANDLCEDEVGNYSRQLLRS